MPSETKRYVAGVEGGGTSWRVAIGSLSNDRSSYEIIDSKRILTTTPEETLGSINQWLRDRKHLFYAVGIASFGPVDPKVSSPTYGYITATPKELWRDTDVISLVMDDLDVPCAFDTDVNAPALAEYLMTGMAEQDKSSCAYITVGTGIGVGLVVNGKPVHGLLHPEAGHVSVPQFPGEKYEPPKMSMRCKGWHEAECLSAKASVEARILAASGEAQEVKDIPDDHPVWESVAHYVGALCANLVLVASPEKIVLGGGIMQRTSLFPLIRSKCMEYLNGYIQVPELTDSQACENYITAPKAGPDAGLVGSLLLAVVKADEVRKTPAHLTQHLQPAERTVSTKFQPEHEAKGFTVAVGAPVLAAVAGVLAGLALGRLGRDSRL